jgi:hypothetical protein
VSSGGVSPGVVGRGWVIVVGGVPFWSVPGVVGSGLVVVVGGVPVSSVPGVVGLSSVVVVVGGVPLSSVQVVVGLGSVVVVGGVPLSSVQGVVFSGAVVSPGRVPGVDVLWLGPVDDGPMVPGMLPGFETATVSPDPASLLKDDAEELTKPLLASCMLDGGAAASLPPPTAGLAPAEELRGWPFPPGLCELCATTIC